MARLPGHELYRTPRVSPAMVAGVPLGGCFGIVTIALCVALASEGRGIAVALTGIALIAMVVIIGVTMGRPLFVVTTEGIGIRNRLALRWHPWGEIRRVDVERRWRTRGQVIVHLVDGSTVTSRATGPDLALLRGEGLPDADQGRSQPLLRAIDAHRAWLAAQRPPVR